MNPLRVYEYLHVHRMFSCLRVGTCMIMHLCMRTIASMCMCMCMWLRTRIRKHMRTCTCKTVPVRVFRVRKRINARASP